MHETRISKKGVSPDLFNQEIANRAQPSVETKSSAPLIQGSMACSTVPQLSSNNEALRFLLALFH